MPLIPAVLLPNMGAWPCHDRAPAKRQKESSQGADPSTPFIRFPNTCTNVTRRPSIGVGFAVRLELLVMPADWVLGSHEALWRRGREKWRRRRVTTNSMFAWDWRVAPVRGTMRRSSSPTTRRQRYSPLHRASIRVMCAWVVRRGEGERAEARRDQLQCGDGRREKVGAQISPLVLAAKCFRNPCHSGPF